MTDTYAKSRRFWYQLGWSMLTAVITGISALLYVVIVKVAGYIIWPDPMSYEPFSGTWQTVLIMTVVGLGVGILHRFTKAEEIDAVEAISEGQLSPDLVPGSTLVSILSLAGGFSLGPEIPTGVLSAGIATWISDRFGLDEETRAMNVFSGVMSAYAGIFSSPTAIMIAGLELPHKQTVKFFGQIFATAIAGVIGFSIFVLATDSQFSQSISLLELPTFVLEWWHIPMGLVFGILGVVLAIIFGILFKILQQVTAPLKKYPIVLGGIGGFLIGLLSFALPITMFYGADQLGVLSENAAEIGFALLLLLAFAKIVATTGALATGFIGGPIFPLFFVGGAVGLAINVLIPEIPVALVVACLMVALPAALLPIPFTLAVIALLLTGFPVGGSIPVFLAALTANVVTNGFGLLRSANEPEPEAQA